MTTATSPTTVIDGGTTEWRERSRELTDAIRGANPDSLVAIDEGGGDLPRLYFDQGSLYPGSAPLGRIDERGPVLATRLERTPR